LRTGKITGLAEQVELGSFGVSSKDERLCRIGYGGQSVLKVTFGVLSSKSRAIPCRYTAL
jgi:hypothetical protein